MDVHNNKVESGIALNYFVLIGYSPQTGSTSLTHSHLLLAGNDTVLISLWYGGGMHSTGCCCS